MLYLLAAVALLAAGALGFTLGQRRGYYIGYYAGGLAAVRRISADVRARRAAAEALSAD